MKIYVSDDIYEYLTISKRDIHSGVDDDLVVKSLEQHDKELLKEFALEIINWSLPKYGEDIQIQVAIDFETKIRKMLKERGVE